MRLVGASNKYIHGPFVIIGVMYGIVSGLITLALFYPATYWLGSSTEELFTGVNVFSYYISNFAQIFGVIILSGITIGAVSSFLAVKKYLNV
jgi:cell division transport system permease protein